MKVGHTALLLSALLLIASLFVLHSPASNSHDLSAQFAHWQAKYGSTLDDHNGAYRFKVFSDNMRKINLHNQLPGRTYDMGVNQFTALTQQQFQSHYLSVFPQPPTLDLNVPRVSLKKEEQIDWVQVGAVSPVRDQGRCPCSYAFSAVGAIQSAAALFYKQQLWYSVQQVVDCSMRWGNNGCVNGNMPNTYKYVNYTGINTDFAYPFKGFVQACKMTQGPYKIKGYRDIQGCAELDKAIAVRPIAVAVDATNFPTYASGVFGDCESYNVGLAVLLVGMSDEYYKLKVSWGTTWGENGYIRLARRNNICGICFFPSYPLP